MRMTSKFFALICIIVVSSLPVQAGAVAADTKQHGDIKKTVKLIPSKNCN